MTDTLFVYFAASFKYFSFTFIQERRENALFANGFIVDERSDRCIVKMQAPR